MNRDRVNDRLDSIFGSMDGGGTGPSSSSTPGSDFATVHRELRKTVSQVQGIVGLLTHGGLSDHQAGLVQQVQQAIRELARLINHELSAPAAPTPGVKPTPRTGGTPRNAVPARDPIAALHAPRGSGRTPRAASSPPVPPPTEPRVVHAHTPPPPAPTPAPAPAPVARSGRERGTILLAEHSTNNHRLFGSLLQRVDCTMDVAENGEVALEKLSRATYHVALVNCHLPLLSGFDLVTAIRQQRIVAPGGQRLPMILYADPELRGFRERVESLEVAFLAKPYELAPLEKLLQRFLPRCDDNAPASTATSTHALVDDAVLAAMCRRLPAQEFVAVYQRYLGRSPKLIVEIVQAMSSGTIDRVEQAAAVLLNSSAELGAVALAEKCRAITALCRAGKLEATTGFVVGLDSLYRRTCDALQASVEAAFQR